MRAADDLDIFPHMENSSTNGSREISINLGNAKALAKMMSEKTSNRNLDINVFQVGPDRFTISTYIAPEGGVLVAIFRNGESVAK